MSKPLNFEGPTAEKVVRMVEGYLKTPITTDGDWPEVTYDDMHQLQKVFDAILEAKFQRDCDNDMVIDYAVCNRKRGALNAIQVAHRVESDEDVRSMLRAQQHAAALIEQCARRMEWPAMERIELRKRREKMAPVIEFLRDSTASCAGIAHDRVKSFVEAGNSSGLFVGKSDDVWAPLGTCCAELRQVVLDSIGKHNQREMIEDYLLTITKAMGGPNDNQD